MVKTSKERKRERLKLINQFDSRYALVVVLVLLTSAVALLLATNHTPERRPESSEDVLSGVFSASVTQSDAIGAPSACLEAFHPITSILSNDQDHDGKIDGIADLLGVLLCALVALPTYFVSVLSLVGELFLRLCEPSILVGFDYHPALERPG